VASVTFVANGQITYAYDAAGNRTSETIGSDTYLYSWDAASRVITAAVDAGTVTFTYNADSQRVAKESTDSSVLGYLYDHKKLLQETDDVGGDILKTYASDTTEEYGDLIGEDGEYLHQYDAQANTKPLLDASGRVRSIAAMTRHRWWAVGTIEKAESPGRCCWITTSWRFGAGGGVHFLAGLEGFGVFFAPGGEEVWGERGSGLGDGDLDPFLGGGLGGGFIEVGGHFGEVAGGGVDVGAVVGFGALEVPGEVVDAEFEAVVGGGLFVEGDVHDGGAGGEGFFGMEGGAGDAAVEELLFHEDEEEGVAVDAVGEGEHVVPLGVDLGLGVGFEAGDHGALERAAGRDEAEEEEEEHGAFHGAPRAMRV
jgi:YD repeat-containing protein